MNSLSHCYQALCRPDLSSRARLNAGRGDELLFGVPNGSHCTFTPHWTRLSFTQSKEHALTEDVPDNIPNEVGKAEVAARSRCRARIASNWVS